MISTSLILSNSKKRINNSQAQLKDTSKCTMRSKERRTPTLKSATKDY
jgi:hypothetical protein